MRSGFEIVELLATGLSSLHFGETRHRYDTPVPGCDVCEAIKEAKEWLA
jgi:hypothetical protein